MRQLIFILISVFLSYFNTILDAKPNRAKRISQPIQLVNEFLLVELTVNGRTGKFILDSGAPGLILNVNEYPTDGAQTDRLVGLGGEVKTYNYDNQTFVFGDFEISVSQVFGIPLEHLEVAVEQPILGLIGLDVFNGFNVRIDYHSLELEIARSAIELPYKDGLELSMRQYGHLTAVNIQKGTKKLRMILDTGSKSNLIDKNLVEHWISSIHCLGWVELIGADQRVQLSQKVQIEGLAIGEEVPLEQTFITSKFDHVDALMDVKIDGILGQNFFKHYIVVFSKNRKKLMLYRHSQAL